MHSEKLWPSSSGEKRAGEDDIRGCVRVRHLVPNKPDSVLADGPRERAVGKREGLRAPAEPWRALSLCILPPAKPQGADHLGSEAKLGGEGPSSPECPL